MCFSLSFFNFVRNILHANLQFYRKMFFVVVVVFVLCFFETGFLCVALAVLELTLQTRLALNSEICLPLINLSFGHSTIQSIKAGSLYVLGFIQSFQTLAFITQLDTCRGPASQHCSHQNWRVDLGTGHLRMGQTTDLI